jgi:hypothetical protein
MPGGPRGPAPEGQGFPGRHAGRGPGSERFGGPEAGPGPEEIREVLHRVLERVERLEAAMHRVHGRDGGGEMREPGHDRDAPRAEGGGNPDAMRREMEEMRAGMRMREQRIQELQHRIQEMEQVMRKMKGDSGAGDKPAEKPAEEKR